MQQKFRKFIAAIGNVSKIKSYYFFSYVYTSTIVLAQNMVQCKQAFYFCANKSGPVSFPEYAGEILDRILRK